MDEYSRVLSNPENFIISEELRHRIDGAPENNTVQVELTLGENRYSCNLLSYSRTKTEVKLALDIGSLDFLDLFKADNISCDICGEAFEFGNHFEYENSGSSSILILSTQPKRGHHGTRIL